MTTNSEELKQAALPFAILAEEMDALERFHSCAEDGEGYDVPKAMMKRLEEIGLVRRRSGSYYEETIFGLSVLNGDFAGRTAAQGEEPDPLKWRFTGIAGLKRYMTDKQYQAQTPEVKKWYAPICDKCGIEQAGSAEQVSEREAFETWAKREGLIQESFGIRSVNSMCDVAWLAWEERAAISAPERNSEASQLDELGKEVARLQDALAFWLPNVPAEPGPIADRIANDAYLLIGVDGNLPDEKSAQELGWITVAAPERKVTDAEIVKAVHAACGTGRVALTCTNNDGEEVPTDVARCFAKSLLTQQGEQTAPEWISVKDRLPDEDETVLCFWTPRYRKVGGYNFGTATFHGGAVWSNPEDDEDQYFEPTHWMPLPKAPSTAQQDGGRE